jgi:hypothetical protein
MIAVDDWLGRPASIDLLAAIEKFRIVREEWGDRRRKAEGERRAWRASIGLRMVDMLDSFLM